MTTTTNTRIHLSNLRNRDFGDQYPLVDSYGYWDGETLISLDGSDSDEYELVELTETGVVRRADPEKGYGDAVIPYGQTLNWFTVVSRDTDAVIGLKDDVPFWDTDMTCYPEYDFITRQDAERAARKLESTAPAIDWVVIEWIERECSKATA